MDPLTIRGTAVAADLRRPKPHVPFGRPSPATRFSTKDSDPNLVEAAREARRRWPEFVSAFESRTITQSFSAKVRLGEGDNSESLWISVSALEGDYLYGALENEPSFLHRLCFGSRVRASVGVINDWLVQDGESHRGGFTIDAMRRSLPEKYN
jgi:uncharacterized protein YegJ (DUF2314 family)